MRRMLVPAALALLVCCFSVIAACSGDSSHKQNNPVPVLTSVSPTSATVGGAAFTLTVNGSSFVTGSIVRWNGAARTTTYVSSTQLTAAIPAADLASTGAVQVAVANPIPGGGTSSAITVTIQSPTYLLTDLGTLGGSRSKGVAINASGQVTGFAYTAGDAEEHAFVTQNDVMIDLGTLGGSRSYGNDINASGQVTGFAYTAGDAEEHAFVTQNDVMIDLGTLGGSRSYGAAINTSGQVTGFAYTVGDAEEHAFVTQNGVMIDLGTLGGSSSYGAAINTSGQVTGIASTAGDAEEHAFVTQNGVMIDLGTLGGRFSYGTAINASGQVTGMASTAGQWVGMGHPFVTQNGVMIDLGTLGGRRSGGVAINASGQVAGASDVGEEAEHAFVTQNDVMIDLGTLGGSRSEGNDINASGQVTGWAYTTGDTESRAFLYSDRRMLDLNSLVNPDSPLAPYVVLTEGVAITDTGYILANGYNIQTSEFQAFLLSAAPVLGNSPSARTR